MHLMIFVVVNIIVVVIIIIIITIVCFWNIVDNGELVL